MAKYTIDRKKWVRGNGLGQLANNSGCLCIMGFVMQAAGVTLNEMCGYSTPEGCMYGLTFKNPSKAECVIGPLSKYVVPWWLAHRGYVESVSPDAGRGTGDGGGD